MVESHVIRKHENVYRSSFSPYWIVLCSLTPCIYSTLLSGADITNEEHDLDVLDLGAAGHEDSIEKSNECSWSTCLG